MKIVGYSFSRSANKNSKNNLSFYRFIKNNLYNDKLFLEFISPLRQLSDILLLKQITKNDLLYSNIRIQ